jgi:hypothetical protein
MCLFALVQWLAPVETDQCFRQVWVAHANLSVVRRPRTPPYELSVCDKIITTLNLYTPRPRRGKVEVWE